jgi:chemotaxis response regulator CheB
MAFVIAYHFPPTAKSQLADILSKHTEMPVLDVSTAMHIQANHVYVCPPNDDIYMEDNTFRVATPRVKRNTQIDVLFSSLAMAMGHRAIGIIFSGYGGDGAEGCKVIKAKGGSIFAQDQSAEVSSMPQSAQATGCVDFVLSPEKMADRLYTLAKAAFL